MVPSQFYLKSVTTHPQLGESCYDNRSYAVVVTSPNAKSELCRDVVSRDVVSRPRPGLTLPLFVPILRHAHQSGHLIRKVPSMI